MRKRIYAIPALLVLSIAMSFAVSAVETPDYWAQVNKDGNARNASAKNIQGALQLRWAKYLNNLTENDGLCVAPYSAMRSNTFSIRDGRILCVVPDTNPDAFMTSRNYVSFGTFLLKDGSQVSKVLSRHYGAGVFANSIGTMDSDLEYGLINHYWKAGGPLYTSYSGDQCHSFVIDPYNGSAPINVPFSNLSNDPNSSGYFSMSDSNPAIYARGGSGGHDTYASSFAGFLGGGGESLESMKMYNSYLVEGDMVYAFDVTDLTYLQGTCVTAYRYTESPYSRATRWTCTNNNFTVLGEGLNHCRGAPRAFCLSDDGLHLFMFGFQNTATAPDFSAAGGLQLKRISTATGTVDQTINTNYNPVGDGNVTSSIEQYLAPQIATKGNYVIVFNPEMYMQGIPGSLTNYFCKSRLFCFDTSTGNMLWQKSFPLNYFDTVAVAQNGGNAWQAIQTVISGDKAYLTSIVRNSGFLRLKIEQFSLVDGSQTSYLFDPTDGGASIPLEDYWHIGFCDSYAAVRELAAVDQTLVVLADVGRLAQAIIVLEGASNPAVDYPPKAVISKPDTGLPLTVVYSGCGAIPTNQFDTGAVIQFSSLGSVDPDGGSLTYDWNFGDGTAHSNSASPTHTYASSGTPGAVAAIAATLTVTDNESNTSSVTMPLKIRDIGASATTVLNAVEDAYIYCSGGAVANNYGSAPELQLWKYVGNPTRKIYLKFDLGAISLSSIEDARVRIYSRQTRTVGKVRASSCDSTWSEATITGKNAPLPGNTVGETITSNSNNKSN